LGQIYCISGFGADERVFSKLNFGDHTVKYLPWEIPKKAETLLVYTQRFIEQMDQPDPILVGLSFGGMVTIEIAKQIPVKKILMISSVKTAEEMPWYFRMAGKSRINKIIPLKPYSFLEPLENYNLGVETEEEKILVREYRQKINPQYSNWAIDQIINWHNTSKPENIIHIHGSNDHIFPIKNIKANYVIQGGGHLMLMNRAGEVNEIIKNELST
jgi:pimeloyl-ACP methyl ester carboxylesterase